MSFETGRPRPARIRTAGCCWSQVDVDAVLATPDQELTEKEFELLFEIAGCVGSYEECVYFLPLAAEWLMASRDEWPHVQSNVVYFISSNAQALRRDSLLEPSWQSIRECFFEWTRSFEIERFPNGVEGARGAMEVKSLLDSLLRCEQEALVSELLESLLTAGPVSSAWFLEYARAVHAAVRGRWTTGASKDLWGADEPMRFFPALAARIQDRELLLDQLDLVKRGLGADPTSSNYWYSASATLGLAAA